MQWLLSSSWQQCTAACLPEIAAESVKNSSLNWDVTRTAGLIDTQLLWVQRAVQWFESDPNHDLICLGTPMTLGDPCCDGS